MPFSCLSSVGTLPPSSFVLRLILGSTHRQSLSAYTGLFRQRLLGRDCASLSGHLGSRMSPKAKYILECYSINVKRPVVRFCAETIFPPADKREFGRVRRTVDETAKVQLPGSRLTYCRRVSPWHQSTRRSIGHERNTSRMPRLRPF